MKQEVKLFFAIVFTVMMVWGFCILPDIIKDGGFFGIGLFVMGGIACFLFWIMFMNGIREEAE